MPSNAEMGMTIQKIVCDKYEITPCSQAASQFDAAFNPIYKEPFERIIGELFQKIGSIPVKCLTYEPSDSGQRTVSPHNFLLKSGETLSFRTNIKGDKIAPRTVGQAGLATFNEHFQEIIGKEVKDKEEIKQAVIHKIDKMLPVFVDCFFDERIFFEINILLGPAFNFEIWVKFLPAVNELFVLLRQVGRAAPNVVDDFRNRH